MDERIDFVKKRDIGDVIQTMFQFYIKNFKELAQIILYLIVPLVLVFAYIGTNFSDMFQRFLQNPQAVSEEFSFMSVFIFIFLAFLMSIIPYMVTLEYCVLYYEEEKQITVQMIYQKIRKYIWKYSLYSLAVGVILILTGIVGIVLLFTPVIYLSTVYFLLFPIFRFENKNLGDAMSRCFVLIKNNWWNSFLVVFVTYIIVMVLSTFFNLPNIIYQFSTIFTLENPEDIAGIYDIRYVIFTAIAQLGSSLVAPIFVISSVLQFFSLKEQKESSSLLNRIDNFGKTE